MTEPRAERARVTISDPQVMRALAHPVRLAITEYLSSLPDGATATECAEIVGQSPSATSYHLRELAKAGLIEPAPSRGDARERVWRTVSASWTVDAGRGVEPETRAAERALVEAWLARDLERSRDWLRRAPDEPAEWYDAARLADIQLLLTPDELAELNEAVFQLMEPYRKRVRTDPPPGVRTVSVHYKALPLD
ncbi:helix-turn-helix domain-containing protein [Micromonospora sp. WMMD812]|uniref:helix-turn-helix domain-containing protein n=1 Tax=Micromonospora sp. WMMD812 TaxID=3015152 RepID=UPI00248C7C56|nr:helix-turn-helix domain-containing protein [Micromonospora sp. WMMD812]WBB65452.1 helix-turn-helix domain-containing protein [Micromonospora sp. WMMD812]